MIMWGLMSSDVMECDDDDRIRIALFSALVHTELTPRGLHFNVSK